MLAYKDPTAWKAMAHIRRAALKKKREEIAKQNCAQVGHKVEEGGRKNAH